MKANTKKFTAVLKEIHEIDIKLGRYDNGYETDREILGKFERRDLEKSREKLVKKAVVYHEKVTEEDFENGDQDFMSFWDGITWEDFQSCVGYY